MSSSLKVPLPRGDQAFGKTEAELFYSVKLSWIVVVLVSSGIFSSVFLLLFDDW